MAIQPIGNSGTIAEVESASRALRMVQRPDDYGSLGIYAGAAQSGTMAAGLAAGANIVSFRNSSANVYLVRRVFFNACGNTTAFAAGVFQINMFVARSFTASDSAGTAFTLTGNNLKRRTSMATSGVADIRASATAALTAGTRTLDAQACASLVTGITAAASLNIIPPGTALWDQRASEYPLVCAQNEGFVIQATVPATGTWNFSVRILWEELTAYS